MSKDTSIQWCDSTVNPTMGCDGCELWERGGAAGGGGRRTCYAGVMHARWRGSKGYAKDFNKVELFPGRMAAAARWGDLRGKARPEKPWLSGMPRTIFVSDMSDALSAQVPFGYLKAEILDVVSSHAGGGARHIWMWLSKRPSRMAVLDKWHQEEHGLPWPPNLWAMTSVTGPASLKRLDALFNIGDSTTVRGASFEPVTAALDLRPYLAERRLSWAVFGGESEQPGQGEGGGGVARECRQEWVLDAVEQCRGEGVPVFVKQLGSRFVAPTLEGRCWKKSEVPRLLDHHGGDWGEWPAALRVREMPAWEGCL